MVNILTKPGKKYANLQLIMQLVVTLLSFVTVYFCWGFTASQSALAGGAVSIIPNIIFAQKAFKFAGASAAKQVVDSFNKGVKIKMILTAILFVLCFKFLVLTPIVFFTTYSLTMVAPWLTAVVNKF
ncbi:F0F1 ATP synthase assembly protein I [Thalassomonas sp. M1454]|nr:F0F1 ATP synthase assembly protein I [Thalassomonas sp. M1454]